MKIIKNGKKYDTDTAKEVGSYQKGYGRDLSYYREELYRKKTGEFFLYGEGGGLSPHAHHFPGGGYCEGEKIVPMSKAEAKSWCEQHLSYGAYVELFGEPEE